MKEIVELQMKEIRERVSDQGLEISLSENAQEWLAEQGYDPAFGARPLKRALQKFVESPLSIRILQGEFQSGDVVSVEVNEEEDGMTFTLEKRKGKTSKVKVDVDEEVDA